MCPLIAECDTLGTCSVFISITERGETVLVNQGGVCQWLKHISERVETEPSKSLAEGLFVLWMRVTYIPNGSSKFMRVTAEWVPDIFALSRTDWEPWECVSAGDMNSESRWLSPGLPLSWCVLLLPLQYLVGELSGVSERARLYSVSVDFKTYLG